MSARHNHRNVRSWYDLVTSTQQVAVSIHIWKETPIRLKGRESYLAVQTAAPMVNSVVQWEIEDKDIATGTQSQMVFSFIYLVSPREDRMRGDEQGLLRALRMLC